MLDFGGERLLSSDSAVDQVCVELARSSYPAIRQLNCERHGSIVTIAGLLPCFHQKQIVISLVMKCLPMKSRFDDEIDIVQAH